MKKHVTESEVPYGSEIIKLLPGAYFFDSYQAPFENKNHTAIEIYLSTIRNTPLWVNRLMTLRNKVVSKLGLKDLGHLDELEWSKPVGDYQVGDRVGIFTIYSISEQEVILEDSDRHLDVKLSIYKNSDEETFSITTIVHVHNLAGRVYMFFVAPVHKRIVPAVFVKH